MVGASKILTVSYGTFSCTLEGFDEPFSTMKAIAEYFRDLAADDRYFGAEPPTPDAEMLHRIAEREIHRRVEAKISANGVVLRQTEIDAPQAEPAAEVFAPTPEPVVVPEPVAVVAATIEIAEPATTAVEPHIEPQSEVAEMAVMSIADTIDAPAVEDTEDAAEMAPVDVAAETDAEADLEPEDATLVETAAAPEDDAAYEVSLDAIMADVARGQTADADIDSDDDFATADNNLEVLNIPTMLDDADTPEADSVAAKLMRIRAVVEGARAANAAAYEDDDIPDMAPRSGTVSEDFGFALDLSDDAPELRAAEAARAEERATNDQTRETVTAFEVTTDETPDVISIALADAEMAADQALPPVVETSDDAEILATLSTYELRNPSETAAAPRDEDIAAPPPTDTDTADEAPHDSDHPSLYQRARARVIRLSKIASLQNPDVETAEARTDDAIVQDHPDQQADIGEGRAILESTQSDSGDDLTRLMDEAKSKLEGAETRRRFSAISHLKAAVAATLADRKMHADEAPTETETAEETDMSLYRDDLSKAVRPRRPAADTASTTRRLSMDMRPAPLVLVSEQRVDRTDTAPSGAVVRPRRIAVGNLAVYSEDDEDDDLNTEMSPENASSFAEFAESRGATTLTEMLEAAAAYTASVEGQPHFSRPQIMRKVKFVAEDGDFTREDGLRSFGVLLRQGTIQKVSPGQFTIADTSKFMPGTRRAR